MTIAFEKIIPTTIQAQRLYELLQKRVHTISHNALPSYEAHAEFVFNHPYVAWYLLHKNNALTGSVYLQADNSIGVNLSADYDNGDIENIIRYIQEHHQPLPAIPSVRRGEFFIHVAADNVELMDALKGLGKRHLQSTFLI